MRREKLNLGFEVRESYGDRCQDVEEEKLVSLNNVFVTKLFGVGRWIWDRQKLKNALTSILLYESHNAW